MADVVVRPPQPPEAEERANDHPAPPDGVVLRRLLAVATLTPAQAGLLARDLVTDLRRLREEGDQPGRVTDRSTVVSTDGTLEVQPENGDHPGNWVSTTDSAAEVVRQILRNTGRGGTRRRAEAAALADQIEDPVGDLDDLTRMVDDAVPTPPDEPRVRRQLAVLVAGTKGRGVPSVERTPVVLPTEPPVPRAITLAPDSWRPSSRRRWHRRSKLRSKRTWLLVLLIVLVGALLTWGIPRGWSELRRGWQAMFTPEQEATQHMAPVSPPAAKPASAKPAMNDARDQPRPVKRLAPLKAGAVTQVKVATSEPCRRGAVCPVRVDVHLQPEAAARQVSWSLRVVDRCTGKTYPRSGASVVAEPWWRQVYGLSRTALPKGRALAIIAVTKAPARAASQPLLIPQSRATC